MSYTFSKEPIVLMKYHLLLNYENFIFINGKKPIKNYKNNSQQDFNNRITYINELGLFNNNISEYFMGKNKAFPISLEFFCTKGFNSKKDFKNYKKDNSVIYYIDKTNLKDIPEDGKFIESIIGDVKFFEKLKNSENNLGELMDIKYFIDKDFTKLHNKFCDIIKSNNKGKLDKNSENKNKKNLFQLNNDKTISNENNLETLEDFENAYLVNGYFVYPDSFPIYEHAIGEEPKPISKGEQEFLDKYQPIFEKAMRAHLHTKKKI